MNRVQPIRDKDKIQQLKFILKKKSFRNYLIFQTGINTGLRVSDIVKLTVSQVRNKTHIVLKEKKTGKTRRIVITDDLKRDLKLYIEKLNDDDFIFKSRQGINQHLSRKRVYAILKEAAKECKIDELGTHTMRKTFGYHHYKKNNNVALLAEILNHSKPEITLKYIGFTDDEIDKSMQNIGI